MVANAQNPVRLDERDDLQHQQQMQQAQRILALAVIAPRKSPLASLIEQRLAELYERLGEAIDPAKRTERNFVVNADALAEKLQSRDQNNSPSMGGTAGAVGVLTAQQLDASAQLASRLQDRSIAQEPAAREVPVPKFKNSPASNRSQAQTTQSTQAQWVWMLSQLIQTDLNRLGFEPDEFDDIRILLIKKEAGEFDKFKLLSHLPDSLSPDAQAKIFEDIRTIAAGYVALVMIERVKSDVEQGQELKQMPEVPRSISNAFYGIPMIDFNPEDVLKRLD
jgi:hypothetical protein